MGNKHTLIDIIEKLDDRLIVVPRENWDFACKCRDELLEMRKNSR